ncbi:MAG: DUF4872 domain-containing protein [Phycisphaerae bacterium]|nr:DUF4872 domain-containing protein [Phycisphaerae bacterium]
MTAHKHFKALVRERMVKTGESYTSARRQILRDSTEPAAAQNRRHTAGSIPPAVALRVLLNAAGLRDPATGGPISEALAFGVAGGIGIGVAQFFYEKEDFASLFVAGRHAWHDDAVFLRAGLERLGVAFECSESGSAKAAEANLRKALAEGNPCVAFVDMACLPHRAMPPQYQGGGYHVIVVYSIDDARGVARIGDVADEPIEIALADLAKARARIAKFKNRIISLKAGAAAAKADIGGAIRAGLAACHAGLVTPAIRGQAKMFTLAGLESLAERMADSKDADRWERVFADGHRLWSALTGLHDYVENYGTGGGLCRPMFADFLAYAGARLKQPELTALSERYRALGRLWTELSEAALPDDVPAFRDARERFAQRAEAIASGDIEALRGAWAKIAGLQYGAKEAFPLSAAAAVELRRSLQQRVHALHREEVAAHAALGEALAKLS